MKTTLIQKNREFRPVTISLTFETERELRLFYQIHGQTFWTAELAKANTASKDDYDEVVSDFAIATDPNQSEIIFNLLEKHIKSLTS